MIGNQKVTDFIGLKIRHTLKYAMFKENTWYTLPVTTVDPY